jgi:hypothetical protein
MDLKGTGLVWRYWFMCWKHERFNPLEISLETPKIRSNCETKIGDLVIGLDNLYLEKRNSRRRRRRRRGKRKGGWTKMMEGG